MTATRARTGRRSWLMLYLPEAVDWEQEGKVDVREEAHAMVQDVVVSEAPEVPKPEVKSEEVVVRDNQGASCTSTRDECRGGGGGQGYGHGCCGVGTVSEG
ncbi:hypothetical protein ACQJBY_018768 [Aegilops geniculata]